MLLSSSQRAPTGGGTLSRSSTGGGGSQGLGARPKPFPLNAKGRGKKGTSARQ